MSTPANSLNISSVGLPYFTGTAFQAVTDGAANSTVLIGNGVGVVPSFTATPQITGLGIGATSTGTGLTFDGVSTLSIFSQGTFTPTMDGAVTSGTFTYDADSQIGRYQKVGSIVTVSWFTGWTSVGTATGNLLGIGLPFTSVNITNEIPIFASFPLTRALAGGASTTLYMAIFTNDTRLSVGVYESITGNNVPLGVVANASIRTTLTYETI